MGYDPLEMKLIENYESAEVYGPIEVGWHQVGAPTIIAQDLKRTRYDIMSHTSTRCVDCS
jgi:hypothetical protein